MIGRTVLAVVALALGVTAVVAQDAIAERKALMKRSGAQARIGVAIVKGEQPYDQAKVDAIFAAYLDKAAIDKFEADTKAAQASSKDAASFKAAFEAVGKNCGGCHQPFRKPQS